jgi:hypothetical protein
MVKVTGLTLNQNGSMKNYINLDNGKKVNIGKYNEATFQKFFGDYAAKFQNTLPYIQHDLDLKSMDNTPFKTNMICGRGPVFMDTAPYLNQAKDFLQKADFQDDGAGHLIVTYEGFSATFDI